MSSAQHLNPVEARGDPTEGWTFATAAEYWLAWQSRCDESVWDHYISAERYILRTPPATPEQAITLLNVLIGNADSDTETRPLANLLSFLRHWTTAC